MQTNEQQIFSVTQITNILKEIIEGSFPTIKIEGEISNYKAQQSGHLYFTLKDEYSQISVAMWKSSAVYLSFKPKDGQKVLCTGRLSLYGPQGRYQLIASKMELSGVGDILQMLEERKKRFAEEGLFESAHKKSLPLFPKTVGIVTSPTGAAVRDILQVGKRRNPATSFIVLPANVQGEGASFSIAKKIQIANQYKLCDALIVGRGGGSLEDLLPFSEECVVRAIYDSKIPVVSAVGHEIDWALSDFVADVRAPTPSAAAELVVPEKNAIIQTLQSIQTNLYNSIKQKAENYKLIVRTFNPETLENKFRNIEQPLLYRFDSAKLALLRNTSDKLKEAKHLLQKYTQILEGASPKAILARGYSLVKNKSTGAIIKNANDVLPDDELEIIPAKGSIFAKVIQANKSEVNQNEKL